MIADVLLIAGALGAAMYCWVLSRRLRRFNDLEKGMGGAIAVLSHQVDDLTQTLKSAQSAAEGSVGALEAQTGRAEAVARRLELMLASLHDLPDTPADAAAATAKGLPESEEAPGSGAIAALPTHTSESSEVTPLAMVPNPNPLFSSRRRRAEAAE